MMNPNRNLGSGSSKARFIRRACVVSFFLRTSLLCVGEQLLYNRACPKSSGVIDKLIFELPDRQVPDGLFYGPWGKHG